MRPLVEGTLFPKWKFVLRMCDSCPLYNVFSYKRNITSEAPRIIVEWNYNVYTAQDDIVMKGYNPPEYSCEDEMMYKARFWNPVSKAKYWYTSQKDTVSQY